MYLEVTLVGKLEPGASRNLLKVAGEVLARSLTKQVDEDQTPLSSPSAFVSIVDGLSSVPQGMKHFHLTFLIVAPPRFLLSFLTNFSSNLTLTSDDDCRMILATGSLEQWHKLIVTDVFWSRPDFTQVWNEIWRQLIDLGLGSLFNGWIRRDKANGTFCLVKE